MRISPGAPPDAERVEPLAAVAFGLSDNLKVSVIANGAGNDESIPRTFLAFMDIAALAVAFLATGIVAPSVQAVLLSPEVFGLSFPAWLSPPGLTMGQFPPISSMSWVLVVTIVITIPFTDLLGGYTRLADQSRTRLLISSTLPPLISLGFLSLAFFALKAFSSSRVFVFTFGAAAILGLLSYRSALRAYKRRRLAAGAYAKNVVLVGSSSAISWMAEHFRSRVPSNRYQLAGWLSLGEAPDAQAVNLQRLGLVEDLGKTLVNCPIHEVLAVQSSNDRNWLRRVIEDCGYFRVTLRIVPEALLVGSFDDLKLMFRSGPLALPEVVLSPPHHESDALFLKRLIDISVSITLLALLAPLFLLISACLKATTPHLPVLYPWRVIGLKGRAFTGYKFTTMVADADARLDELRSQNEMNGPVFKVKQDPRVTPLGRFLRKYSLNELPQLWSVLKGDMSLVGPRPAFRHELERYELWQKRKLCVKPGLTCLWQVSGRNRINNFDDWVRLDLRYIDEWSLWLDFRILIRTIWAVLSGSGS